MTKPKLRFYRAFKNEESFLKMNLTCFERSHLAQLRLGILPLMIELGRFRNINLENRLCTLCNLSLVQDEKHFLFICPAYATLRNSWFNSMNLNLEKFNTHNENELIRVFEFNRQTAKYIVKAFELRKTILFI